jgi:peptidoglycan pentaglycine glycine transferase (the first glycine)
MEMTISEVTPTLDTWDDLVAAAPDGHLLQSHAWGELKNRHGWSVQRIAIRNGDTSASAQVLWRKTPIGRMAYVGRGPALSNPEDDEALRMLIDSLHDTCRAGGAVFLKVEPNAADPRLLPSVGFRASPQTVQPRVTLMLDLTQDLDTLMQRMLDKTRYNIRLAARKGVTVRHGNREDMDAFSALMKETAGRNGFQARTAAYYREAFDLLNDKAVLLLAEHEGDLLSGMLLTMFNGEATYLFGGSSSHKRNLMAGHLIQWEAIKLAKEAGMERYDFWAVPTELAAHADAPENEGGIAETLPLPQDSLRGDLWGVYRFKRGFGGSIRTFSGAYDYVYDRKRYWLWHQLLPHALTVLRRGRMVVDHRHRALHQIRAARRASLQKAWRTAAFRNRNGRSS